MGLLSRKNKELLKLNNNTNKTVQLKCEQRHFFEDMQMVNRHMKRYSTSLTFKKCK